jgi:hypothetical protein
MTRNRLYLLLASGVAVSYAWLAWQLQHEHEHVAFTPCPIKMVTGIACPSCGVTRSLSSLAHGNFINAAYINPLGLVAALILIIVPLWLLYDLVFNKDSLLQGYKKFEEILRIKWVAIPLIALIFANWMWNIYKGL